jgi:hypothetical protein
MSDWNKTIQSDAFKALSHIPAPEGEAVACVIAFREGRKEPELISWNKMPVGEHRLYASPVVPVGSGEDIANWIGETPCRPGCSSWQGAASRNRCDCDRDAILAALGTKATDTGREG